MLLEDDPPLPAPWPKDVPMFDYRKLIAAMNDWTLRMQQQETLMKEERRRLREAVTDYKQKTLLLEEEMEKKFRKTCEERESQFQEMAKKTLAMIEEQRASIRELCAYRNKNSDT